MFSIKREKYNYSAIFISSKLNSIRYSLYVCSTFPNISDCEMAESSSSSSPFHLVDLVRNLQPHLQCSLDFRETRKKPDFYRALEMVVTLSVLTFVNFVTENSKRLLESQTSRDRELTEATRNHAKRVEERCLERQREFFCNEHTLVSGIIQGRRTPPPPLSDT